MIDTRTHSPIFAAGLFQIVLTAAQRKPTIQAGAELRHVRYSGVPLVAFVISADVSPVAGVFITFCIETGAHLPLPVRMNGAIPVPGREARYSLERLR